MRTMSSSPEPGQVEALAEKQETPSLEPATSYDEEGHRVGASANAVAAAEDEADPAFVRRLKWKLDLFILPVISAVYFFAAIGRSDLANAKIAGLSDELQLSAKDYSNAASFFLIGYIVFQLPGTVMIKQIRAPVQFAGAMLLWGFFTVITTLVKTRGQLLALRFLIGGAEAFVQGGVFYLSFWYEYGELATRGAIFFSMSTLAGAFNGLIAYGITKNLDGARGWRAWRWIFLVEGVIPIAFSFLVLLLLPATPETVRFGFTERERRYIVERSRRSHNTSDSRLAWRRIPLVLADAHFWLFTLVACGGHFCLGSFTNFLPAIIQGLGYRDVEAQAYTVIVYACAFVGILFWCRLADVTNRRGLVIIGAAVFAVAGYALLVGSKDYRVQFAATTIVAFGVYPQIVLHLSWAALNFIGYTRRGSALAFFNIFSQLFAISGTQAYSDPPYYHKGNSVALGLSAVVIVSALILMWYLSFMNRKKAAAQTSDPNRGLSQQSVDEIGDKHPDFMYTT
ncbi:MFS general substrate transporter [Xylariaceae sp. FL0804]|nr:MFS general substrate transporter [Xylariaceae sp. FL0804]